MATSDLTLLKNTLENQAAQGSFAINAGNLQTASGLNLPKGLDALLQNALLPAPAVTGFALTVNCTTIQFTLSNSNQTLTISNCTVNVLNLVSVPLTIIFTNDSGTLQFTLNMAPPNWSFGASFPFIGGSIEGLLDFEGAHLIFSTTAQNAFVWEGTETIDLKAGLNFAVGYNTGNITLIKEFIAWGDSSFTPPTINLTGSIQPPAPNAIAQIFPSIDISASIAGNPTLNFPPAPAKPFLKLGAPSVSLESSGYSLPNVFFNLQISIGDSDPIVLDVKTAVIKHSNLLRLSVMGEEGIKIGDVFGLIPDGKKVWNIVSDSFLGPSLNRISFLFFSADFSFGYSKTITSLQAAIGSTSPLNFYKIGSNYLFAIDTFIVNWTCLNPLTAPQHFFNVSARFQFPEISNLVFNVSISTQNETVSGSCNGTVSLSGLIGDLNNFIHNTLGDQNITIPVPFDVSLSDFQVFIDHKNKVFSFGATANAELKIMDQEILGVQNAQFTIKVSQVTDPNDKSKTINEYDVSVTGILDLFGINFNVNASIATGANPQTTFSINMVNQTLGSLLDMLVKLVSRDAQAILPFPWSKLNDISMDALVLTFTISKDKHEVSVTYSDDISLGFIDIKSFTLTYEKQLTGTNAGTKSTLVSLDCSFFGKDYNSASGNAMAWDPVNGNPPAVPDKGTVLDIRYLGLGQHISFSSSADTSNMQAIIEHLENIAVPPPRPLVPGLPTTTAAARPLNNIPALSFNGSSNWFVGADMTIMGAVSFAVVFNDPELYGLIISLSGPKVKALAGLRFEIMYRKINDTIGEYYTELKVPTAMRQIQMGEVSITLPVIGVAIYTNGNFEIDFGFPWNNDFSRSFGLQVFPFVGAGGFYFGVLDGATSTQTPVITNGAFNPVIVFGFGLQVGLGKSVNEGILSADVEVDLGGIVQGVYANFQPDSKAIEPATFFKLQGVVAISGVLSGSINFAIIQATVSVHVYAEARVVYEVHQPIQLGLDVGVSVEVSVKILFIKIHFSFSATISESYTIGSATPTPWVLAANQPPDTGSSQQTSSGGATKLTSKKAKSATAKSVSASNATNVAPPVSHGPMASFSPDFMTSRARTVSLSAVPQKKLSTSSINWSGSTNAYFTTPPQLELDFVPTPTALDPAVGGSNNVNLVAMLYIENSIDGGTDSSFNQLLEAILAWTLKSAAINGFSGLTQAGAPSILVSYNDLENLHDAIVNGPDPQYSDIKAFLSQNFSSLNITAFNGTNPADKSSAVFPMIPELTLNSETGGGTGSTTTITNFKTQNEVDANYVNNITTYLQSLNIFPANSDTVTFSGTESLPTMVFNDYFHLIIRAVVQAAKNALSLFNYEVTDTTTTALTAQLNALGVDTSNVKKPSFVAFAHANKGTPLAAGQPVSMSGLDVVIQKSQANLNDVANTLMGTTTANPAFVESLLALNLFAGQAILNGSQLSLSTFSYAIPNNAIATVNALFGASATVTVLSTPIPGAAAGMYNPYTKLLFRGGSFTTTNSINTLSLVAYGLGTTPSLIFGKNNTTLNAIALQLKLKKVGNNTPLPSGTVLNLPEITYQVPPDSQYYISRYFGVSESNVTGTFSPGNTITIKNISQTLNGYLNLAQLGNYLQISNVSTLASTLAGQDILAPGAVFTSPDFSYTSISGDTPEVIAQKFDVDLDELIFNNLALFYPTSTTILVPNVTVSVQTLMDTLKNSADPGHQKIPFNNVAGQVSRFLLHGLRLPNPGQTIINPDGSVNVNATTSGLYSLLGQQFSPGTATGVSLTNPGGDSWITFAGGSASSPISSGSLASAISDLQSAATTFTFNFESYPLYRSALPRYTLPHQISWAAPQPPEWMGSPDITNATANPSIWLFPENLIKKLGAENQITLSLHNGSRDITGTSSLTTAGVKGYRWGTLLNLKLRQIKSSVSSSGALSYIYEIEGLKSEAERHTLTALIQAYQPTDKPEVYFLFDGAQGGVVSDLLNTAPGGGDEVRIVKSNLSTIISTAQDMTGVEAGISKDPLTFLELIWEGSLLHNGGFYLQYQNAQGKGLPAYLFSQGPEATVKMLVLCPTDITQVSNYHNAVVLQSPIDITRNVLFAQADDLSDYRSVMKAGNLGLKITCNTPATNAQIPLMYNLLTAQVGSNTYFNGSIFAMPAGPVQQPGGSASTWEFHHLFPISKMAINKGGTATPGFPDPAKSPYNAVGATLEMDFYFQDIFGNQAATQKKSLPAKYQTIGYFDQIISLSQWPGLAASFDFNLNGTSPQLNTYLHFDATRYLPLGQRSLNDCISQALKDQGLFGSIYYQLTGSGVTFNLQTSMGSVAAITSAVAQAAQLAGQMYQYAATVQQLTAPGVIPASTTNLENVASTYHLSIDELATANKSVTTIFAATTINKPIYYTVKYGDSINSICDAANSNTNPPLSPPLVPATWASTLSSLPNILRAGTVLTINATTVYTIQPGDTIESIATKFSAIAGVNLTSIISGNLSLTNLFADSIQLLLAAPPSAIPPTIPPNTPSLENIAKAWSVTTGQLALANATTPLSSTVTIAIPNAYSLAGLTQANNYLVYTVNTNQSLSTIIAGQNFLVEDLFHANQGLLGVLNLAPITLSDYPGITYTPDSNDTLLTVLSYFQGEINNLTTETFINQIESSAIFNKGATILLPPGQVEFNTTVTPGYTAQIFEITASLTISRTSSLIDASLPAGLSGVQSVTSTLTPHTVEGLSNNVSLKIFAQNFETTFANVKVGVHRQSKAQTGKNQHLWAVPLVEAKNAPDNNTLAYYLDKSTATYFAPAPLANQRVRRDQVPIYPYRSGIGISTNALPVNFVDIDMDQWAATFLSALGKFTSAEFSMPASDLNNTAFISLMQAKQSLAGTIANSVIPIMDVTPSSGQLIAAQESLNERLLQDIAAAYDVESIVQLEVDVKNSGYDAESAPRLTGKPVMKSYTIQQNDTLQSIAKSAFAMPVSVNYLGTVLAEVPGLIQSYALTPASFKGIDLLSSQDSANIFDQLVNNDILHQSGLLKITVKKNTPLNLNAVYQSHESDILNLLLATQTSQNHSILKNGSFSVTPSRENTLFSIAQDLNYKNDFLTFIGSISTSQILAPKALNFGWNSSPCTPADTLLSLAVRFDDDLYTLVLANLENKNLLQAQSILIQKKQYTITTGETLLTLLDALNLKAEDFQSDSIQSKKAAQELAKLPGLFAIEGAGTGIAGVLRQQQALNLSTADIGLTQNDSYLTFLLEKTGKHNSGIGENAFIDFVFKVNAINMESGQETLPGFEDYSHLSFVLPFKSMQDIALEIPIPLREAPQPPTLLSQNAVLNTTSTNLETLKQWAYEIEYNQYEQSQDEIEVSFSFNTPNDPNGGSGSQDVSGTDLFSTLANFISVWPYLEADLNSLPHLCESLPLKPDVQKGMVTAMGCFADMANNIANAWTTWKEDKASLNPSGTAGANEYRCLIQEFADENGNFGVHIRSLNNNLPKNALPVLQVVDSNGTWSSTPSETSVINGLTTYIYLNYKNPKEKDFLTYEIAKKCIKRNVQLQMLDIMQTSKVWGEIAMSRNQDLINGQNTNADFVYVTPWVKFINPCVPYIVSDEPVDISAIPGPNNSKSLEGYLSNLFYELLDLDNKTAANALFPLTVSCHYLFALNNNTDDALFASTPVFMHPLYDFTPDDCKLNPTGTPSFVQLMATTIENWYTARHQSTPAGNSRYQLSVTVLTNELQPRPYLELSNLFLELSKIN